ncbi:MAG TPA: hypothetical protein PKK26_11365, partial [Candidatus Wallbacteria bacterium]|nr:hypothetical protein [Candidatus Wallbacteria bacterium]
INIKKSEDDMIEMQISDNGIGIPAGSDLKESSKLGIKTVFAISEHQLHGDAKFESASGLTFTLKFKNILCRERI